VLTVVGGGVDSFLAADLDVAHAAEIAATTKSACWKRNIFMLNIEYYPLNDAIIQYPAEAGSDFQKCILARMPRMPVFNLNRLSQALLLGAVIFTVFYPACWLPFNYDDSRIVSNPEIIGPWRGIIHWLMTPLLASGEDYEAIPTLLDHVLYALRGKEVLWYRLASLVMHWSVVLMILTIYRRLLGNNARAFCAAVLFAIYPAHSEIIAIATFKKHLFVSLFGLGMILFSWRRCWPTLLRLAVCWSCMALALLSKESALILPVLCLFTNMAEARLGMKAALRRDGVLYSGLFSLNCFYVFWRLFILPRPAAPLAGGNWLCHGLTAGKSLLWYFIHLPWPHGLCQEHTLAPASAILSMQGLLICVSVVGLVWGIPRLWARDRILGLSLTWICLCLMPFLNIIPFANLSLVADRYMYMASAGLLLGFFRLAQRIRLRWAILGTGVLFVIYTKSAMGHLFDYSSPMELWTATVACAPDNPRGHANLGVVCVQLGMYDEAEKEFDRALIVSPGYFAPDIFSSLAVVYARTGRLDRAISIGQARALEHPAAETYNDLGAFLLQAGDTAQACVNLEKAFKFKPEDAEVLINFGLCQLRLGHLEKAEVLLMSVPDSSALRPKALARLGELYIKKKLPHKAEHAYERSLALNFFQPETVKQLANLYACNGVVEQGYQLYRRLDKEITTSMARVPETTPEAFRMLMRQALDETRHNEKVFTHRYGYVTQ